MILQLALVLAVLLVGALMWLRRLKEWHHGYLGLLLCLIPWTPAKIIGLILLADDTLQHVVQCFRPAYLSPFHQLYAKWLWPMAWVQRLTAWLDGVMK